MKNGNFAVRLFYACRFSHFHRTGGVTREAGLPQILAELEASSIQGSCISAFPLRFQDLLTALLHIT